MNIYLFLIAASLLTGVSNEETSGTRKTVEAAIRTLSEQASYTWKSTRGASPEGRFRRGPTEGKTIRGGLTHVVSNSRGRSTHVLIRGDRAAVTNRDGDWELVSLRDGAGLTGRFTTSIARSIKTPAVAAAELLASVNGLKKDGLYSSGSLSYEGARARLRFGRGESAVKDVSGVVRFWLVEGVLAKYEVRVRGTLQLEEDGGDGANAERRIERTTTVEIFDIGTTEIEAPEKGIETLRGPLPTPVPELPPEVARAILERHGKRNARVHDPSTIVKYKDEYWLFATGNGVSSWRSRDLAAWEPGPRVFATMPAWVREVVPTQRGHFWAPDVIRQGGRYLLYYSVSRFGVNTSAIALASNSTLDPGDPAYAWTDHGIVIRSRRSDDFNAIDPAVIRTSEGKLWMSFGSYWSGIKLVELDGETGKRIAPDSPVHSLANYRAIEAPHIFEHGGLYYLFVNWDRCCRGVDSTYNIRVGRSPEITGPYVDQAGVDLLHGGGTLLLGSERPFFGPGHANILEEDGAFWFSCHFYDGTDRGRSMLSVRPLSWSDEGWPVLATP